MQLPPGYLVHPQNPAYMYNPQTGDVREVAPAVAPPAPPAPAPAPVVPAAQPVPSYGTVDVGAMGQDSKSVFGGGGRKIYIDMPKSPTNIGESSSVHVRLLPPWSPDRSFAHVKYAEHRLPASMVPDPGKRQWVYATCYGSEGGPGACPICEALKQDTTGDLAAYKPRGKYMWQALQLDNLQQHFTQRMDPATGRPAVGADGGAVWDVVPGILRMPPTLHRAITVFFEKKGDATHPESGYGMELIRSRTGAGQMEVSYSAMDLPPEPLSPQLKPVLAHLYDLSTLVHYYSREEMEAIAQHMLAAAAAHAPVPQQQAGLPAAYQAPLPAAYQAPPAAPPAAPAAPPVAQPPLPTTHLAPPTAPLAPPPASALPPTPPAAAPPLPPATAPGGVPAAPPALSPNVPPAPAPAPGLPPGMASPPPAPPAPPATPEGTPPAQGMSPEQFEQSLEGGAGDGQAPF